MHLVSTTVLGLPDGRAHVHTVALRRLEQRGIRFAARDIIDFRCDAASNHIDFDMPQDYSQFGRGPILNSSNRITLRGLIGNHTLYAPAPTKISVDHLRREILCLAADSARPASGRRFRDIRHWPGVSLPHGKSLHRNHMALNIASSHPRENEAGRRIHDSNRVKFRAILLA